MFALLKNASVRRLKTAIESGALIVRTFKIVGFRYCCWGCVKKHKTPFPRHHIQYFNCAKSTLPEDPIEKDWDYSISRPIAEVLLYVRKWTLALWYASFSIGNVVFNPSVYLVTFCMTIQQCIRRAKWICAACCCYCSHFSTNQRPHSVANQTRSSSTRSPSFVSSLRDCTSTRSNGGSKSWNAMSPSSICRTSSRKSTTLRRASGVKKVGLHGFLALFYVLLYAAHKKKLCMAWPVIPFKRSMLIILVLRWAYTFDIMM